MTEENKDKKVKFELVKSTSSPTILMKVPQEGDMNYLFLSPSQARHLLNELHLSLKEGNGADILVVPFPKEINDD